MTTSTSLRIKFESLYWKITIRYHKMGEDCDNGLPFDCTFYDETIKMESSFKRLFWSILKAMGKELGSDWDGYINTLKWKLRHGDIDDFYWMYKEQLGLVPSWQR